MFPCDYFARGFFPDAYFPPICVVTKTSGGLQFHPVKSGPELESLMDRLYREDEEILAIVIGAVQSGVIR